MTRALQRRMDLLAIMLGSRPAPRTPGEKWVASLTSGQRAAELRRIVSRARILDAEATLGRALTADERAAIEADVERPSAGPTPREWRLWVVEIYAIRDQLPPSTRTLLDEIVGGWQ